MYLQNPNTIALFGPQATRWTQETLSNLQSQLLLDPHLYFLKNTLIELPSLWPQLEKRLDIVNCPAHESLQQLSDFATGKKILDEKSFRNIHLAPLTIVEHVVQLISMAEKLESEPKSAKLPAFLAAQGFCIGFLSAAAFSSSHSWAEFVINASNALRIAACIGAIVDHEDAPNNGAKAVSVRWKTDSDRTYLDSSLDMIPNVSCEIPEY
jgi:hypothetical protein